MRFRPQTWLLLSVLLFLAGGYMWHLADQRQAALRHAPSPAVQPKKISKVHLVPQPKSSLLANLAGQSSQPTAANTNPAAAARAERFRYRLANTTQTIGQLARRDHAILLENALVDTDVPFNPAIPAQLRAQGDPGAYIVQARGPLDDAFRAELRNAGAEIISYIPNNAYLVRASAAVAQRLAAFPQTQTVLPYEPYYKLKSDLLKLAVNQKPLPADSALNVTVFAGSKAATLAKLQALGAEVVGEDSSPFGPILKVQVPADALAAVAGLGGVQEVELLARRAPANDLSRVILGVSPDTTSGVTNNYLHLDGSGVTVAVNDTGVDASHPDFGLRVFGDTFTDTVGHGTHVAGIIAGDGTMSDTVINSQGSINPGVMGQYRGKASAAKILSLGIDFSDAFISDSYFQETTATNSATGTNAFISNNSWGFVSDNGYNIVSASYDAAVRDSLPGVTGSQPIVYVFAAGNDGQGTTGGAGDESGVGGEADTISAPATAKNVISVGASELPRNVTNTVEFYTTSSDLDTNGNPVIITNLVPVFAGLTDSSNEVASFSSRGNVGIGVEGDFGRFKPDVVAPGTFAVSTRSQQWDTNAYYNITNIFFGGIFGVEVAGMDHFDSFLFIPENAVYLKITLTNLTTGVPLTNNLGIYANANTQPPVTFRGNNSATINFSGGDPSGAIWFFSVINTNQVTATFDVLLELAVTNQNNLLTVISNMNNGVGPWYRYESGTSMATPAVSGVLALMQQFFEQKAGGRVSPAMMKALLINGARNANSDLYDFQVQSGINYQGWGMVNLPNSVPAALTNNPAALTNTADPSPIKIFDQNPATALATGQYQTRTIRINSNAARNQPLRVTLVWTDPPGNPAAGIKLVNDLDLIVTNTSNLTNPVVFFGNDIGSGRSFSQRWDTNATPNVDFINNVENIYLQPPLGSNYTITVAARRVNVNAVTAQTNTAQDYALVISDGNGTVTNAITVTDAGAPVYPANLSTNTGDLGTFPLITTVPDGVPLLGQHAGANSPLVGTDTVGMINEEMTLGSSNQWHFYVFTNTGINSLTGTNNATNVAFITFLPPTMGVPREGVFAQANPANASRPEADIDLYVSTNAALLNLDPTVISNAANNIGNDKSSKTRGGTEFVVYDGSSHVGEVYYIGIHAEDRQAATYGFFGIATDVPFTEDNGNSVTVHGMPPRPVVIPDGTPTHPGVALIFGIVPNTLSIRRVVVTNDVSHELFGDLFGQLSHSGVYAVLNNHTAGDNSYSNHLVYEDNGEGDIPGSRRSDGPGNLQKFVGEQASGVWNLTMVDNSQYQTGQVERLNFLIEKSNNTNGTTVTIGAGGAFFDFVDVPPEPTNLVIQVALVGASPGPVDLYVRRGAFPTQTTFDYALVGIVAPGGQLIIDASSIPPLEPGRYFIGVFNPTAIAQTINLQIIPGLDLNGVVVNRFVSDAFKPILDDAVTDASQFVTATGRVASVEVGLRIEHPRESDLAITLVSPSGTRVLLAENRGGDDTNGYGSSVIITNVFPRTSNGGPAEDVNVIDAGGTYGKIIISYNFFPIPDTLHVYYEGIRIWDTGLISGSGTLTIPFGPGLSTDVTIIMNEGNNTNFGTAWTYTATVVTERFSYATFTEDTTKTITPIKYAIPPFRSTIAIAPVPQTISDFETNALGSYSASINPLVDGWTVTTNTVIVATNPPANTGTNFLKLLNGEIRYSLPTTNLNHQYKLSFAYHGVTNLDPIAWWPGDDNPNDIVGGNNGQLKGGAIYTGGEVNDAFYFPSDGAYVKVPLNSPSSTTSLEVGTNAGFTVECWIDPANVSFAQSLVNWSTLANPAVGFGISAGGAGSLDVNINDVTFTSHTLSSPPGLILPNELQHVALTFDRINNGLTTLYLNGVVVAQTNFGFIMPNTITPILSFGLDAGNVLQPTFLGVMDEIAIFGQALSSVQIQDIHAAGSGGKCATLSPPTICGPLSGGALVQLQGLPSVLNIVGTTNWQTTNITFAATGPGTTLIIRPPVPDDYSGILLDSFTLADLSGDAYYLPEESLDKLKGELANGQWNLELWDNRVGATIPPPMLLSWKLSFIIDNLANSRLRRLLFPTIATNYVVDEMTLLTVPNTANAATPGDTLSYTVTTTNQADGTIVIFNPPISNGGVITWMPTEDQGPGIYTITTVVTETGLSPGKATNIFTVIVNEVNQPPVLPPDSDQTAFVNEELVVDNSASDPDVPVNPLTYTVTVSPPAPWLNIDTSAGLFISGTPTAGDIGDYTVTTVVTDYNADALTNQNLSATNHIQISVTDFTGSFATGIPAFTGAEGAGGTAVGGRGGDVYHVTNLSDSGPGSLRAGLTRSHRTIVFDVSGTIDLGASFLRINRPYLTLAGQTAPGDGITLKGWVTSVQRTHDVVIRHLRFRPGDVNCPANQDDAFHFVTVTNSIADHITATWSIDENLSVTHSTNVTVQWSMIAEPLNNACHDKGEHGYGSLLRYGYGALTFHHNLYAHNNSRNPRLGDNLTLDFVNNVIYNWGILPGYSGDSADLADNPPGFTNRMNYVGNCIIAGSDSSVPSRAFRSGDVTTWIYQTNNVIDDNLNLVFDGLDTGWAMFSGPLTQAGTPFILPPPAISITPDTAPKAYERVLAFVGANRKRDAVDLGVVNDVRNLVGNIINSQANVGGWPLLNSAPLPLGPDPDNDGLPDAWELTFGLDPNDGTDGNLTNSIGYTRLEDYLNWMADPHAIANTNELVNIDLQALAGNTGNLSFSVGNGTNGVVFLPPGSHIAQFTPASDFGGGTNYGLASFNFYVTNNVTTSSFGPVNVNVLVSKVPVVTTSGALSFRILDQSTNSVRLEWDGASNQVFNVRWTTNIITPLSSWGVISNSIATPFNFTNSVWSFTDDGSQTGGFNTQHFYRLVLLP